MFFALDYKCSGMVLSENKIVLSFNNTISYVYEYKIDCSTNYLCDVK